MRRRKRFSAEKKDLKKSTKVDLIISHLPVELAVVDHRQDAEGLDGRDRTHGALSLADLDDVNGVVVALKVKKISKKTKMEFFEELLFFFVRVFSPSLFFLSRSSSSTLPLSPSPLSPRYCRIKSVSTEFNDQPPPKGGVSNINVCVLFALFSGEKVASGPLSLSPFFSLSARPPFPSPYLDLELGVFMRRVLPRLRQQSVVPVDVVRVEPQVPLLDVLLDRVARLGRRDLHLGARLLRDLADEVERAVVVLEGDIVPP